ncbi:MAG: Yip1 family protein [Acidobacteriota bacterium]
MDLQTRVTRIITKPALEWPVIASESTTVKQLYTDYILLLAAIPVLCLLVRRILVGRGLWLQEGLSHLVVQYLFALAGVYVAAFVIEKLAPSFQSSGTTIDALKLVAYASTPGWIAGVLLLLPGLGALSILAGLYGIYLFYLGLPFLMKTPKEKVIPYMLVSAIVIIALHVVAKAVS